MREVEVMNQSAFTWSVVIAGALAAWAVTFLIMLLGAGIGLAVSSPYAASSSATMNIGGALWLVFAQTAGFVTGGYLAARLRIRDHIPGPETLFRDAAHGFMVWVIGVGILAFVIGVAGASATSSAGGTMSDAARQAMTYVSFWSFVALLFGAVAAPLAGMLGGELRDDLPTGRRPRAIRR
jgi:glucan phosphoethanolaminetransferase (alkaline phosphatase superfamily)